MKPIIMKLFLPAFFLFLISLHSPLKASPERGDPRLDVLKKEVTKILQKNTDGLPEVAGHEVTVGFLINARNEVIILDVNGDSAAACEYVKQILNYNKVKFCQARQLIRYSVTIHLVSEKG